MAGDSQRYGTSAQPTVSKQDWKETGATQEALDHYVILSHVYC